MGIFKIPKTLCDTINSTLAKYWWGHTNEERKIHWINWAKLCTPKQKGGMGFRDIQAFNLALLAKQAWRLIHNTHSLFYKVHKARYFPNCSLMDVVLGHNHSYVWRSVLATREIIREGACWKVGDGIKIEVSMHKWLFHKPVFLGEARPKMLVCALMDTETRQCDREKIFDIFAHRTQMEILSIHVQNNTARDSLIWKENGSKKFTMRSTYQVALICRSKQN